MDSCVHDIEKPIMSCSRKLIVEKWEKKLLFTFFHILYKFYLYMSKIQVLASTVFEFYFWSLLEQHVHTFKFFKAHFWKDFITVDSISPSTMSVTSLSFFLSFFFFFFFYYFWLLISVGALEIARRVNNTAYSSSNSYPGGQKYIQVLKKRKDLPNWKSHQENCFHAYQEKHPCGFSLL